MPRTNPHLEDGGGVGDVFGPSHEARGWQAGYDAGIGSPHGVPATPLVRVGGFMDAFAEGAAAGSTDGAAGGWRLWAVREEGPGAVTRPPGTEPVDSGETGDAAPNFPLAWPGVGPLPLLPMLTHSAPEAHAAWTTQLAGLALRRALAAQGDPGRLYLPVCLQPEHSLTGDAVLDAGYWHGTVSGSFGTAGREAAEHALVRVPHFPGLVRYRPEDDHNFWEWLPLAQGDLTLP
ncbi:hypothetical protein ACFY8O_01090 [Streptomyces argenteolus]|uniref:Uncharacterized protein n=1 Tax=Streptomyces argenteolus TaxID=67274 RepID=A0ABW6X0B5_9ACTN